MAKMRRQIRSAEVASVPTVAAMRVLILLLLVERWSNLEQKLESGERSVIRRSVATAFMAIDQAVATSLEPMDPSNRPSPREPRSSSWRSRRRLQTSSSWPSSLSWWGGNQFDVLFFGAKGDGASDDTQAFQDAWDKACAVAGGIVLVPKGYTFVVGPIMFSGPCKPNIVFQVDGKIFAVESGAKGWALAKSSYWLQFKGLVGLTIGGMGWLDGNGATWWKRDCKKAQHGGSRCKRPTVLKVFRSTNLVVKEITISNSPQIHMRIDTCSRVLVTGVTVISPADTLDTDGFYFANTHKATLQYSTAAVGDDCVSIQSGCSDILIQNFRCGPGHGISIGDLGEMGTTGCVSNVRVRNVVVENALGALRIKTWQGGSGSVSGIMFEDVIVRNVKNPIIIDQYYCDSLHCKNSSSKALAISNVSFRNIEGTYDASDKAVYVACNDWMPCTGISMINVNLWPAKGAKFRYRDAFRGGSFCWKALGYVDGFSSTVDLKSCIQPQPSSHGWRSTLSTCQHLCSQ